MLLQQLIQKPTTSSQMFVCDPFRLPDKEELAREVIGLANADVEGPRYILFGINPGAMEGKQVVGINEDDISDLKKAHRLVSSLVEPIVHLAFIFDRINNRLVGALEIDGCDEGPYAVGQDTDGKLVKGHSWIRNGRDLRDMDAAELAAAKEPEETDEPDELIEPPPMRVGFNEDPECVLLEMDIPDSSDPPFAEELEKARKPMDLKQTLKQTVGTMTTRMLDAARSRNAESDEKSKDETAGDHTNILKASESLFDDAQNHYFFEEKALQANFCVCNDGEQNLNGATIEFGFPKLPDFDVADRLHASPFDKSAQNRIGKAGYPKVEHNENGVLVVGALDSMSPGSPQQAFKSALRFAVGPAMAGKKLGIVYTIRGKNEQILTEGRMKIVFGKVLQ